MKTITYREALNEAMAEEMHRDPAVFVYGLDVSDHKRIFGITSGLVENFGPGRCFITPLCEDAMTGFGLGAAINGLRPVHIHIRVDFMLLAMNQIANMLSSCRYMSGGVLKVPMVIQAIIGRGWGQSCQHSKSLQSIFAHIPGIKVLMPASPANAKGLLKAAIRDDNPVIVLEHRWLFDIQGPVPEVCEPVPIGVSEVVRQGRDLTLIATSWMVVEALKAAEVLERLHGVSAEVVDPRSISPVDQEGLCCSVRKTGHAIVADYDWVFCGFSAEVAAILSQNCFDALKGPVRRLGFLHSPCPTARVLENQFYPTATQIIREAESMLGLPEADLRQEYFYSYENKFKGPF
jgi:pyruvate dehydrogenase E1 component beta subunit